MLNVDRVMRTDYVIDDLQPTYFVIESFADLYVLALVGIVIAFLWEAVMTRLFGGTPMKLAFGMRVVRADNGQQVEWSHAITRWAIPGAFALIPLPVLPGLLQVIVVIIMATFSSWFGAHMLTVSPHAM